MAKRYAPVTRGLSSSAYTVIERALVVGRTSQNSQNAGNSSPVGSAVSIARPRAESPKTSSRPSARK
ncbi:hypothetical protein D3C83_54560 [compost metagenome]